MANLPAWGVDSVVRSSENLMEYVAAVLVLVSGHQSRGELQKSLLLEQGFARRILQEP